MPTLTPTLRHLLVLLTAALLATLALTACGEVVEYAEPDEGSGSGSLSGRRADPSANSGQSDPAANPNEQRSPTPVTPSSSRWLLTTDAPDLGVTCTASGIPYRGERPALEASCDEPDTRICRAGENSPPLLGQPTWLQDDAVIGTGDMEIESEAILYALLPFEDPDCNVTCGAWFESSEDSSESGGGGAGTIDREMGCGSAESGYCFTVLVFVPEAGETWGYNEYEIRDVCDASSNLVRIDMTPL